MLRMMGERREIVGRTGKTMWDLGQGTQGRERGLDRASRRWVLAPTLAGRSWSVLDIEMVRSSRTGTC
jgi:hypothetical protein